MHHYEKANQALSRSEIPPRRDESLLSVCYLHIATHSQAKTNFLSDQPLKKRRANQLTVAHREGNFILAEQRYRLL